MEIEFPGAYTERLADNNLQTGTQKREVLQWPGW